MQTVSIATIVREVKIILDENTENLTVLDDDPNQLQLDELIESRIVDAVRMVHESAPSHMLDDGLNITSSPVTKQDGTGYLSLPDDFMRLIIFKLQTWSRPVIEPISDTDPRYFAQHSRFRGIRGGTDKPVAALTTGTNGRILEFFSVKEGTSAVIEKAKYLPIPKVEDESIKICRKLVQPTYWQCAGLVMTSYAEAGQAQAFLETAQSFIAV